jgi:HK97 gp10 family phage protein
MAGVISRGYSVIMAFETIKIAGLDELRKELDQFPAKLQEKAIKSALKESGEIVLEAARSNLDRNQSVHSGGLKASLALRSLTLRSKNQLGVDIYSRRKGYPHSYVAHLVEKGHKLRQGGFSPAKPFMRPALDNNVDKIITEFQSQVGKMLDKYQIDRVSNAQ